MRKDEQWDGHIWRWLDVNFQLFSTSALGDSVVIQHQTRFWLLASSSVRFLKWNTHDWYSPFACQKYDWLCWITHSNFNYPLLFQMKDSIVLWCEGRIHKGLGGLALINKSLTLHFLSLLMNMPCKSTPENKRGIPMSLHKPVSCGALDLWSYWNLSVMTWWSHPGYSYLTLEVLSKVNKLHNVLTLMK